MKLRHLVPFGLLEKNKPRHFTEMLKVVWENRRALPYAWRVLNHGVCDGCSLGPYGLKDNVIDGVHLCLTRLKLLKLNTMNGFDPARLPSMSELRSMSNEQLQSLERVPVPLYWKKGTPRFSAVTWDDALSKITTAIDRERSAGTPERVGFYATSRGLTNGTYYVLRKLASLAGTNNVDLCARLCHAASVDGLKATLGVGAPTCSLSDLIGTDLVVIFGSNLANNQPVTMKYLHHAKKRGAKILVVNPFLEPGLRRYWVPSIARSALFGTKLMDEFFQVTVGGDIAFMYGVLKALDEIVGFDRDFVSSSTTGAAELQNHVRSLIWEDLENHSGLTRAEMKKFAGIYAKAKTAVFVYSMGLTQHRFGVDNVKMIANLALSRGMLGREKCGIIPIRGHSGVQGGGECGVDPEKLPGGVPLTDENARKFEKEWGGNVARKPGSKIGQMMDAAHQGKITVLYSVGGNLFETMPDPDMKEALQRIPLRVHQDIVLNTSTLLESEEVIVLPAQTRYEQTGGGTSTNTERRVRFTPEISGHQVGESKAEWKILCEIGRRLKGLAHAFAFETTEPIRNEMGRVMPVYKGIENLKKEGDFLQWGGAMLFSGGKFDRMPEGKAKFMTVPIPDTDLPEGHVYVTTRRGKQFNSMTYGQFDPLTNRKRSDIFVSKSDAQKWNLKEGDPIALTNGLGTMKGTLRLANIRPGNVQVHWPEGNAIITRRYDPVSGEPDFNALARILTT